MLFQALQQFIRHVRHLVLSLEDDMLEVQCSLQMVQFLKSIVHHSLGRKLALIVYANIQKKSERYTSSMRNSMLQRDLWLSDTLSFASSDVP